MTTLEEKRAAEDLEIQAQFEIWNSTPTDIISLVFEKYYPITNTEIKS